MEFATKYTKKSSEYISPSGDGYMNTYAYKYNDDGTKELVIDGKTNVKEAVQADFESCDINSIMARFVAGETDILDRVQGIYADFTKMPTTWADLYKMQQEGENQFMSLPVELREMFNHSPSEFFASAGSKEWNDKIESYADRFVNHQFDDPKVGDENA